MIDGMTMFEGAEVIRDTGILDVEVLENYIVDTLGEVIGESYAEADHRIAFVEGTEIPEADIADGARVVWIAACFWLRWYA